MKQRVLIVGPKQYADRAAAAGERAGLETVIAEPLPGDAEAAVDAARAHRAEGIYGADEFHAEMVAAAAAQLGFPGPSQGAARLLRDKEALRSALAKDTDLNPYYGIADTPGTAEQIVDRLGLPVVFKPVDGACGRGTLVVREGADAPLAFTRAAKASVSGRVLLEKYLHGREYRVICHRVKGEWSTLVVYSNVPAETDHLFDRALVAPVRVVGPLRDKLRERVRTVMGLVNGIYGVVVLEFMASREGLYLIELGHINESPALATNLFPAISGIDLLEVDVASALGRSLDTRPHFKVSGAIWWLAARSGVVSAVHGIDKARAVPGVVRVEVDATEGTVLGHQVDGPSRDAAGYVVATARSPQRALEKAQYASEYVRFETQAALEQ
ncbi:MAG: ATP-grasp domain-containing protein [Candidatus Hydrogenedentes bacterium]|nr:ATP-grasp domain-containing protein [Candidatus Hydrogenedentota bacterium]